MQPMVKITKSLALNPENKQKRLLQKLRNVVREVKAEHPELADYELYDVGLLPRHNQLEVTLYFHW